MTARIVAHGLHKRAGVRAQQQVDPSIAWAMAAVERESTTHLYVRRPTANDAASAVSASHSAQATPQASTHLVRKVGVRGHVIGIGFLAACTAVGILAGTAIAVRSSPHSNAHPAAGVAAAAGAVVLTVQPITNPPPSPPQRPIVKPIADPH